MAACELLGKANYEGKVHSHSPALVTILQSKTKKFTDKNANVLKGTFVGVEACAKQSTANSGFDKVIRTISVNVLSIYYTIYITYYINNYLNTIYLNTYTIYLILTIHTIYILYTVYYNTYTYINTI